MGEQCSVGGYFFLEGENFCWGWQGFIQDFFVGFSDSTDIVQNFYREKKEPKNVIN